jgi:DNA-binding FadR family transcriptional regulator
MEMRAAMAPDIARLAALRRSPGQVLQLDEMVAAMAAQEQDLLALQVLALQFWDLLTVCSDNIAYQLAFNGLRHSYEGMREALVEVMGEELRDLAAYRRIADAVRRRDSEGAAASAQALMQHGSRGILQLLAVLESSDEDGQATAEEDDDDQP